MLTKQFYVKKSQREILLQLGPTSVKKTMEIKFHSP